MRVTVHPIIGDRGVAIVRAYYSPHENLLFPCIDAVACHQFPFFSPGRGCPLAFSSVMLIWELILNLRGGSVLLLARLAGNRLFFAPIFSRAVRSTVLCS
jgi:hypothetical protein